MEDHGTRRFCDRCRKSVHDLSSMTEAQAEYFLLRHRGQELCVRYQVRPDQTVRFRQPPARRAGPVVMALAGLMAACTGHLEEAELDSPEDGLTCEDAAGYTIPCLEPDDGAEPEPPPQVEPEPVEPQEPTDALEPSELLDELARIEDAWTADELIMPPPADGEGCPLQRWDELDGNDYGDVVGVMIDDDFDRAEERRIERSYNKERRRDQRRERRERRRRR